MRNTSKNIKLIVGFLALCIVLYRILFMMIPMINKSIQNNDIYSFMESLTLLV